MTRKKSSPIQVIGAGLPRTGTNSLKVALEELIGGRCHHGYHLTRSSSDEDIEFWFRLLDGLAGPDELRDFFQAKDFVAGVDNPFSLLYKTAIRAFPDAKVILTVRDPGSWIKSMRDTLFPSIHVRDEFPHNLYMMMRPHLILRFELLKRLINYVPAGCSHSLVSAIEAGDHVAEEFFNAWTEDVKRSVPEDKLLIFNVQDGWSPLCRFLNTPIPDRPFPKVNSSEAMAGYERNVGLVGFFIFVAFVTVLLGLLLFGFKNTSSEQ